ncbi:MAG: sulfoxide reductase heme-binding subunit YedZ [Gammaproteobacteria bacterium]|nr:sulfoxide reductase heme-binding subunit YedZ [Gammaproteobacteria bacterium]
MQRAVKPLLFLVCLLPLASLVWAAVNYQLGPDPGEKLMLEIGAWAARLLIATLLVSPLRTWSGWVSLLRLRRMLGLFCFFYASVHLSLFAHFYLGWVAERLLEEIVERPYISAGFTAWLIMLPLALTSNRAMQRRLRRNWQRLHRGVYAAAVLVSLHILWQVRSDFGEALVYALIFALLLAWRLMRYRKKQSSASNAKLLDA